MTNPAQARDENVRHTLDSISSRINGASEVINQLSEDGVQIEKLVKSVNRVVAEIQQVLEVTDFNSESGKRKLRLFATNFRFFYRDEVQTKAVEIVLSEELLFDPSHRELLKLWREFIEEMHDSNRNISLVMEALALTYVC